LLSDSVFFIDCNNETPQGYGVFEIPVREMKELLVSDRILYCNMCITAKMLGALVRSAVCAGYGAVVLDTLNADFIRKRLCVLCRSDSANHCCVRDSDILGYLKQKGIYIGSSLVGVKMKTFH
jgi:hypothetical protein